MKDGLTYEHFHFVIKTSIKLVGFIYLFIYLLIYRTLLSNHFYPGFSLAQIIVQLLLKNFSRGSGWLRFAAQPKLLFFTLGIQTFVLP